VLPQFYPLDDIEVRSSELQIVQICLVFGRSGIQIPASHTRHSVANGSTQLQHVPMYDSHVAMALRCGEGHR